MKLKNIRVLGKYRNTETGKEHIIRQGRRVSRSTDEIFYLAGRGKRVFVSDADFYSDKYLKL